MTTIIKQNGKVKEIQEDGETIWRDEDYIQRPKISQKSRKELIEDIEKEKADAFRRKVFSILTGETVEEAKQ